MSFFPKENNGIKQKTAEVILTV